MFVLSQCSSIIEFWLRRRLKECRNQAYLSTVKSRGKSSDWWTLYFEEWEEPPYEKSRKNMKKAPIYQRLAGPIFRKFILKALLLPLDFIPCKCSSLVAPALGLVLILLSTSLLPLPVLSLLVSAYLRSLSLSHQLHIPLFASKRMTPAQISIWMTERQFSYYLFGFTAALLESIPLLGLFFSVSNRVGAAMYAHDLEKRQHEFQAGRIKPLKKEETYSLTDWTKPSSPKSSQQGKLPFAPQGDDDFKIPGASFASGSVGGSGIGGKIDKEQEYENEQKKRKLEEQARLMGEDIDAPPAYSEEDGKNAGGEDEDGNEGPSSGIRRRVPPPPRR